MKACGGVELHTLLILALSEAEGSVSRLGPLYSPRVKPLLRVFVDWNPGGPQNRCERCGEETNLCPYRELNHDSLVCQPIL
jgi:hypothetical protein